jgi:hypothetical protein
MHPDKNDSGQATEKTKILNDAKDRAIKKCHENEGGASSKWDLDEYLRKFREKHERERKEEEERWKREKKQKEEEDIRRKQEERERKKNEEEEKRRKAEAVEKQEKPIYETLCRFLTAPTTSTSPDGYRTYTKIKEKLGPEEFQKLTPFSWHQTLYNMAETINQKSVDAMNAKTSAERIQAGLRENAAAESKLKDDAMAKLQVAGEKLAIETKARISAEQRLAEIAAKMDDKSTQLAEIKLKMDEQLKVRVHLAKQLAEMKVKINDERGIMAEKMADERRAKDEAEKLLAEITAKMEDERRAKNSAEELLAELRTDFNTFRIEAELKIKLAEEIQSPINSHSSKGSNARKRKAPSGSMEIAGITVKSRVKEFIDSHIMVSDGGFLSTREIQDLFLVENSISDPSIMSDATFQKLLKDIILDTFSGQSGVSCSRPTHNGKRTSGYLGLALK